MTSKGKADFSFMHHSVSNLIFNRLPDLGISQKSPQPKVKYGLDHWTLGPLDHFFGTIFWTIF